MIRKIGEKYLYGMIFIWIGGLGLEVIYDNIYIII